MSTSDERKLATILFADLVGSTALADSEDPERVRVLLERFYDAMAEEIERTGGTIEKFAGDAVMAVWGAPVALEDHAERALHAALAMRARLQDLDERLALRIGVNTGEVVVGKGRAESSFVSGDAVNVSARLEQAAEPGEILAGERTVAAAGDAFGFGEPRAVDAKGKAEQLRPRPVLRALSLQRPRGVEGFGAAFVGRENELDIMRATYRRVVEQGEPHLVSIVGEPGVGKTRLVREDWQLPVGAEPRSVCRTGRCLPYGEGITYWPIAEILREHFGIAEGDALELVAARLEGREILGLALDLELVPDLHPLEARDRLHAEFAHFVEEAASERPLVVLVEDVHWAEDDLLDLLERVVRDVRGPFMLVVTTRPDLLDRRPAWGGGGRRNATTIWLEPLSSETTTALLRELLALDPPEPLRRLVLTRAEGNPFFVEELVRSLAETGALVRSNGGWRLGVVGDPPAIPDTVLAVLAARIDRLPAMEKAALQAAAVVGRAFTPPPVVHLLGGGSPDFALLEDRDFIRRSSSTGELREYTMKHALTRDVAYGTIPKARRGRLHAAVFDWTLENARSGDDNASLLAYHAAEAVRPEDADLVWVDEPHELTRRRSDAVHWLRRAAALARRRSEFDEVVDLLSRAAKLCDDEHECALIWRDVGLAHALRFAGDSFWAAMERALEGPLSKEEEADVYGTLAFQTSNRSGMWDVRAFPEIVARWAERALDLAEPVSRARVQGLLARANVSPGEHATDADEAARLAEQLGDVELRSYALQIQTSAALEEARFDDAAQLSERKLEIIDAIDDPDHLLDVYESAIPVQLMLARLDEARRLASLHDATSASLTAHHRLHSVAAHCEIDDAAGSWEGIVERTSDIEAAIEENIATPCTRNARSLMLAAVAHEATGGDGRELEKRARDMLREGWSAPALTSPLLRLGLLRGDPSPLGELLEAPPFRIFVYGPGVISARLDALAALRRRDEVETAASTYGKPGLLLEPFVLRALGIVRGDDELIARAEELFTSLDLRWHAAQTERLLAF